MGRKTVAGASPMLAYGVFSFAEIRVLPADVVKVTELVERMFPGDPDRLLSVLGLVEGEVMPTPGERASVAAAERLRAANAARAKALLGNTNRTGVTS